MGVGVGGGWTGNIILQTMIYVSQKGDIEVRAENIWGIIFKSAQTINILFSVR